MKQTLLEMVQTILSAMDSDEVNSITDTTESYQVALLLKNLYYDIAVDLGLAEHENLIELQSSGDPTKPTLMTIPDNVIQITWIKYDNKEDGDNFSKFEPVCYMEFTPFLEMMTSLREWSTSDVGEMVVDVGTDTFPILYRKDKFPNWYTIVGDHTLIFDSYKSDTDTTLTKNKTMAYGLTYPTFSLADDFVPDLNPQQFPYFMNRAKVRAFAEIKQAVHQEAAVEARRQKIVHQFRGDRTKVKPALRRYKRYGRKG